MKILFNILFTLITFVSFAQVPCFKAYNSGGTEINTFCVDQEITFQDCGNVVPDEQEYYMFDYKSGSPIPSNLTTEKKHTYTAPGKYRVLHIGNYGGVTLTDTVSRVFEVKAVVPPEFSVKTCASNSVSVTITDTNYDKYTVDFGDGSAPVAKKTGDTFQYQYSSGGTYTILVSGMLSGSSCSATSQKQVTLLPPPPVPRIQSLTVTHQGATGQLQFDLQQLRPGYNYVIEERDVRSGFQQVALIENISQASLVYTLQSINTETGKSFRVRPADACNSTIAESSSIMSSIVLFASSGNETATLTWNTPPNVFSAFEVYRDGTLIETLPNVFSGYTDNGLRCGQTYSYQVKGITASGGTSTSVLQSVQVTSGLKPPSPYLLATFNADNQVVLTVTLPPDREAQTIVLEQSIGGATFKALASINQITYTDAIPEPVAVCYRANFTDRCNNTSNYSNVACPIILSSVKQQDGSVKLDWSTYSGFPSGVKQYEVELLDANNNVVSIYQVNGTTYTDRTLSNDLEVLRYRVKATSGDGKEVTFSNTVREEQEVLLFVPSAFTPNADGLNDVFKVKGRLFSNFSIKIYNSLGNVVYHSTDAGAGWDGMYNGQALPTGAYAYEITVLTSFGATKRKTGTVTLLR